MTSWSIFDFTVPNRRGYCSLWEVKHSGTIHIAQPAEEMPGISRKSFPRGFSSSVFWRRSIYTLWVHVHGTYYSPSCSVLTSWTLSCGAPAVSSSGTLGPPKWSWRIRVTHQRILTHDCQAWLTRYEPSLKSDSISVSTGSIGINLRHYQSLSAKGTNHQCRDY